MSPASGIMSSGCTSLTSITIPDSVTSIGASAFAACTGLTSITIGNSVTSIGDYAFNGCTSLTSITIPDSVTSIGTAAFGGCTGLTSITIGNSVTSIGAGAFNGCTSLTSITIPDSVTSIGASAFAACTSLTEIIFQGAAPTVGSGVFTGVAAGANALVVNESLSSFGENGDNWNGLALGTIFPPVITVTSGTDILELGSSWADAGATADGQEVVTSTGTVDTNTLGSYTITYTATGRAGNVGTATRTVTVVDTTAPVITLSGSAITTVEAGFPYNDAGATADGQEAVTSTGIVDINTVGNYSITYTATDASGNVGTATRTVIVEDTISPVITVTTGNDTVERGSSWTNAGATTTEGSISFTGSVNTDAVGTYTITYSATDSSNNTTTATRTVTVVSSGGEDSFGDVVVYPNNSTQLIGQVTIEGEVAESGDVVAIYVGNELRGKQEVITNGGVAWVNVLVNAAGGNETISFKVYDASTGVTHEKSKSSAVISTGGTVGSFASPLMIEMKDFETQTLSLKEGWNLVSFYVEADDMSPATVFAPIQGKLLQVKNLTQSYDPSVPSFLNTLSSLSVKDGYWLKVSEDVSLSVEGAVPAGASITVKSGWNLVGYPRLSGEAVAEELTSLGNTVVQIKDLGSSYDPSVPSFLNTLSTMAPGSGYWLNVNADGTWNVGTVVEISELNFAAVKTRSDHSPEEKAGPSWGEATVYPNIGATVLAKVSIQGKPVAKGGVVAAFVGNELRGLQDVVLHEGISYVTLNVNLNGEESVSYRVWNPDDNNEYLVSGSMLLELGSTYGKPELLELDAV
ncbi:leucine-rich repeat protein, partial [Akkermansiaceae bacterium]|nr:leucine-rich repeat protein [Akkermansiaceae bacterium]